MQKSPQIIDGHGFLCGFEKENASNQNSDLDEQLLKYSSSAHAV
jgi:hypothetical protein